MELFYWFLIAAFILFIIEILTPGMFAFFSMAVATLITACLTFVIKDVNILIIIDAALAIAVFAVMKNMKMFKMPTTTPTNADRYTGKIVKVLSMTDDNKYRVKIYSEEWSAVCSEKLDNGEEAEIVSIEGITLTLKKIK